MSIKLKALAMGLLAAVAATAIETASAETSATGHFTSELPHITLQYSENETHRLELKIPGLTGIVCTTTTYHATLTTVTEFQIRVTPTYAGCHTTGGVHSELEVAANECSFTLTAPNRESAKTENTVDYVCPGTGIVIHHEGCEIELDPLSGLKGIGYTTTVENNKHSITLTANVTGFTSTFHAGFCVLLGTTHGGELVGSVTVKGINTTGEQVGITATGAVN